MKSMDRPLHHLERAKPSLSIVGLLVLVILYAPAHYLTMALT